MEKMTKGQRIEYAIYYNGRKIGTRIKPFLYGTLNGVSLDLHEGELKPCLCGKKPVLIRDGMLELRFGVFCADPNCPKCPTSCRYYWSWFSRELAAEEEWNKIISEITLREDVGENKC